MARRGARRQPLESSSEPGTDPAGDPSPRLRSARPGLTSLGSLGQLLRVNVPEMSSDDRDAMMADLSPEGPQLRPYLTRFASLIALSASIAGFGLLADSSAVVIGAMLVAPLMTPILATAAALCVSDNARLIRASLVLAGGTALAIVVGWVVSAIASSAIVSAGDLPGEVLARTQPGLLDLAIAVTAGAAGGYVAPRRDALSALPGVGIAVALVPPLATVGICFQVGARDEAGGALLLYLTNLAAIVFAGALMLLLSGVSPDGVRGRGTGVRLALTVVFVAAVAVPLTIHTLGVIEDDTFRRAVTAAIRDWDPEVRVIDLEADVSGGLGNVELRVARIGETRPAWELAQLIADRHDGGVELFLSVEQTIDVAVSAR
ncbi:MAG: DUF389 domain-containing protein [Actinomycetota bacterium]|nr:DUF389 domain-containing protein [Actinomycetota bacterium]